MMRNSNRKTVRRSYVPPRMEFFCLPEDNISLLSTSIGTFSDMENGGDLGGDSGNGGSFNDMDWGGDLGGEATGN